MVKNELCKRPWLEIFFLLYFSFYIFLPYLYFIFPLPPPKSLTFNLCISIENNHQKKNWKWKFIKTRRRGKQNTKKNVINFPEPVKWIPSPIFNKKLTPSKRLNGAILIYDTIIRFDTQTHLCDCWLFRSHWLDILIPFPFFLLYNYTEFYILVFHFHFFLWKFILFFILFFDILHKSKKFKWKIFLSRN